MKKMFSILLFCLFVGASFTPMYAQTRNNNAVQQPATDIIVMKNSTRVDAIITEVFEDVIRYKKASNPNGPVFTVRTSEISSIIYSNGEVQSYNVQTVAPQQNYQQQPAQQQNYQQQPAQQQQNYQQQPVEQQSAQQQPAQPRKSKLQFNPQPSDHYVVGITLGYMQKQNIAHDSEDGTEKGSFMLGKKGATSPAMQLGLTINPTFKYGIGLRTGLFMEYAAEKNATTVELSNYPYEKDVTYKAHDISLSLPLQISYRYEIWNKISVMFYTGPVFAFGAYQTWKLDNEKSKNIYTYDIYEKEKIKYRGFNALWGIGAGFQWDRLRLDMGGEFGMIKKNKQSYNGWEFYQKWNRPFYITLTCFF
jgi:hypothetical protein